ncbi:MAG: rod shape-determining protein MreC [Cytophagales bacterium]|nr:rod shape-determining protein MreC [Cytophagales bacterium]
MKSKNEQIAQDYSLLQNKLDSLQKINDALYLQSQELTHQVSTLDSTASSKHPLDKFLTDTSLSFQYIPAKVINNSVLHERNYLTLNKGSNDGIDVDMGVICADGVVGKVIAVSGSFATVQSLLHLDTKISSKLRGNLSTTHWVPYDVHTAKLDGVERHLKIRDRELITTSGYNSVFPEGIKIGEVKKAMLESDKSHYNIDVTLSTDFKTLYFVYVVKKNKKEEQLNLEAQRNGK